MEQNNKEQPAQESVCQCGVGKSQHSYGTEGHAFCAWHEEEQPAQTCPTCGSDDKTIHVAYQCGHSDCPCTGYAWHECEDKWHGI